MMLRALGLEENCEATTRGNDGYWFGSVHSKVANRPLSVVVTMVGEPKNNPCAAATVRFLSRFSVDVCLLVGISAGLRDKVKLGDAIVANEILYYEGERREPGGPLKRTDRAYPPRAIKSDLQLYDANDWSFYARLRESLLSLDQQRLPRSDFTLDFHPRQHFSFIASGEDLIADGSLVEMRADYDERIRGAEMEGFGFATACASHVPPVPWAVFRGVADFGDRDKRDDWHFVASLSAGLMALDFLAHAYRPPDVRDRQVF